MECGHAKSEQTAKLMYHNDVFFNSNEKLPLKPNEIYFFWQQAWLHNEVLLLKNELQLASNTLDHVAQQGHIQRKNWSYSHQIFRKVC